MELLKTFIFSTVLLENVKFRQKNYYKSGYSFRKISQFITNYIFICTEKMKTLLNVITIIEM
jgi:hypothetical protein